ncbi:MAG TPA: arginase family protein [Alphaproteobacteria bacterium]|nr:arginase family protein [Alphaproteobacteria bacterium]
MPLSNIALIGVPIDCTGKPGGCEHAPTVFRNLGVARAIDAARDLNDLPVRIDSPVRDAASGVKGADSVVAANEATKQAVEEILRSGSKPVMLGGCCSYVMGAVAAARRVYGRIGLAYVDGHMDLYDGKTSPSGECADMPLAFVIGEGPSLLDKVMETRAPVAVGDVSLIGYRDRYLAEPQGSLLPEQLGASFHHVDASAVRARGFKETAISVLKHQQDGAGKYWLHLDWDVLDEKALPSADYLMPNGFGWDELIELVRPLVQSPNLIGMSTACYNPDNDPGLADGRRAVDAMARLFA